jgi:hypothetical protein
MLDYNPWLSPDRLEGDNKGSPATLELPDRVENVPWQTRPAIPPDYEGALADALAAIFAAEIYDLPLIVERLNLTGPRPPAGGGWTEERFLAEMSCLGA